MEYAQKGRYVRVISRLRIVVFDVGPEVTSEDVDARRELVRLLQAIANRCILSFRNRVALTQLRELRFDKRDNPNAGLMALNVCFQTDDHEWTPLVSAVEPVNTFARVFGLPRMENGRVVETEYLERVTEALEDGLPTEPEEEFTANALEHLRAGSLRLALLEAVIGLEIVLTRYLQTHLGVRESIPQKRIDKFLVPDLTLGLRLTALLHMTLPPALLNRLDLESVERAVKFRNTVTHKTGHIPDGVPEKEVVSVIRETLSLTQFLSDYTRTIRASPEARELGDHLKTAHGLDGVRVQFLPRHQVSIEHLVWGLDDVPTKEQLTALIGDLSGRLVERDPRFRSDRHLSIDFFKLVPGEGLTGSVLARWHSGELHLVDSSEEVGLDDEIDA